MLIKLLKYFFIILVYQAPLYSKNNISEDLNHEHLSNYFSGVIAHDNNDNKKALKLNKNLLRLKMKVFFIYFKES